MSATSEALVLAWRATDAPTRELAGELLTRAREANGSIGVPESEPGWRSVTVLGADALPETVSRVLSEYETLAERYDGIPLGVVYAATTPEGVIPTWQSVERIAADRVGSSAAAAVRELERAYSALREARGLLGARIDDARARQWLAARLARAVRRPAAGGGGLGKLAIGLLVVYLLSSATEGGKR